MPRASVAFRFSMPRFSKSSMSRPADAVWPFLALPFRISFSGASDGLLVIAAHARKMPRLRV